MAAKQKKKRLHFLMILQVPVILLACKLNQRRV
jgi:hypothetical protein